MSNEKRFVLFVILVFLWMMGTSYLFPPRKKPPAPAAADQAKDKDKLVELDLDNPEKALEDSQGNDRAKQGAELQRKCQGRREAKADAKPAVAAAPASSQVELVKPSELVLGSLTDKSPGGYLLEVQLEQKGAGIDSVYSSRVRRRARR